VLGFDLQEEYLSDEAMCRLMTAVEEGAWVDDKEQKRVQIFGMKTNERWVFF
jgi:hypothetical protein